MKYTLTIEAEHEEELLVYSTALLRRIAMDDFERALRAQWKYGEHDEATQKVIDRLWEAWHECKASILEA